MAVLAAGDKSLALLTFIASQVEVEKANYPPEKM